MIYDKRDIYLLLYTIFLISISYIYFDRYIAHLLYYIDNDILKEFFSFITRFGRSEWYIIPSIILFWFFIYRSKYDKAKIAIYIFWVNIIAGIIVIFIKVIFGRARPKLFIEHNIYGFNWFEISHNLTSFPSGHTVTAISTAFAFSYIFPIYRYIFIIFGLLISISRVIGCNHFISDVLLSIYLGYFVAKILYKRIFKC